MSEINITGECYFMGMLCQEDALAMWLENTISYRLGGREFHIVGFTREELTSLPNILYKNSTINLKIEVTQ
jgi:hypothetical protein